MSKSDYNIDNASAGITDMGLETTDSSLSTGNYMYGNDLNKRKNHETFSNPQSDKYQRHGRNKNYDGNNERKRRETDDNTRRDNQHYGSQSFFPTKQKEKFSTRSNTESTNKNHRRDSLKTSYHNTPHSTNDSYNSCNSYGGTPRPSTRGRTTKNYPKQYSKPGGESTNLSNVHENLPKSDSKETESKYHQIYQEGPNIFSSEEQQSREDSLLDISYYEDDPTANTKGSTHNKDRKLGEDPNLSNTQQKAENSLDWSSTWDTEIESHMGEMTWQENQKGFIESSTNGRQDTQDLSNSSVFSENETKWNKRECTTWDNKEKHRRSSGKYKREVFLDSSDEVKNEFISYLNSKQANRFIKVEEEEKDLFNVGIDYSLAHCVAEDMNMGSGIAVEFRIRFKKVHELLNQNIGTGGLALLKEGNRFIYYLVTKSRSKGKPNYDTLWSSLIELKKHMKTNDVKKLALPRIGCGLDRLDWDIVKPMLEFLFQNEDSEILVCNLQVEGSSSTPLKKCKVIYSSKPVTEIESETIIIYFASKDGKPTEAIEMLDKKFKFVNQFQRAPKNIGETIRIVPNFPRNYILYGCIVREKHDGQFDFMAFDKCLRAIIKNYKKDNYFYIAFQKTTDDLCNEKILNLMKFTLRDMEIHICGCSETNVEE